MTINKLRTSLSIVLLVALFWIPWPTDVAAANAAAEDASSKLVLVTLDGLRWQEVFGGIDLALIETERYSREPKRLKETYWRDDRARRRRQLFPFVATVVDRYGVLVGDRKHKSFMEVSNPWWFSYPGYNEILTGRADPGIDSNDSNWNPNSTFLEVLNNNGAFHNRIRVFGSWNVFPYIVNTQRSGIPVNAGHMLETPATTDKIRWLNRISSEAPFLWPTVRDDFLTNGYAMEALKNQHPRVLYIAYGETDDFAHDGSYDRYIDAAHRADVMLSRLWSWLQSDAFYRKHTNLIITTDHGRGNTPGTWSYHASPAATAKLDIKKAPDGVPGSNQIWFAGLGPAFRSSGLIKGHWQQSQIAATALTSLGMDPIQLMPHAGPVMQGVLHPSGHTLTTTIRRR